MIGFEAFCYMPISQLMRLSRRCEAAFLLDKNVEDSKLQRESNNWALKHTNPKCRKVSTVLVI